MATGRGKRESGGKEKEEHEGREGGERGREEEGEERRREQVGGGGRRTKQNNAMNIVLYVLFIRPREPLGSAHCSEYYVTRKTTPSAIAKSRR